MNKELNHFDKNKNAIMVDVSKKTDTQRIATASGIINMTNSTFCILKKGDVEKGDVLGVARVAGIMAVKKTWELIPMAHTLLIHKACIDFILLEEKHCVKATCTVKTTGKTGVEMEALTGACVALLTIYDMCKAIDKEMEISEIILEKKSGGKNGVYERTNNG